jgi:hypothetical protein
MPLPFIVEAREKVEKAEQERKDRIKSEIASLAVGAVWAAFEVFSSSSSSSSSSDRAREKAEQEKKDGIISDIESFKESSKIDIQNKYQTEISFDESRVLVSSANNKFSKKITQLETENYELQNLIENLRNGTL